ncbi:hypothetical protein Pelo_19111 [Pelomyxa schiedti]|nr:hypothetical protein Pelo_19111 [Pelomyxa schiedti]
MGVTSWNTNTSDPCTFSTPCEVALSGVYCWADGHLQDLDLKGELEMQGSLPSCISAFGKIANLYIENSNISGTLPPAFYTLTTLTSIFLVNNILMEGTIAPQLSNLVNLQTLFLWESPFQGPILDYLADISTIYQIYLVDNQFTGTIPDLSRNANLMILGIESNYFTGDIPTSFCSLQALQSLLLAYTPVTGQIPACLATLPYLDYLNLEGTYVYGDTSAFANLSKWLPFLLFLVPSQHQTKHSVS